MVIDLGEIDQAEIDHAEDWFYDILDGYDGNDAALMVVIDAFFREMSKELAERPN